MRIVYWKNESVKKSLSLEDILRTLDQEIIKTRQNTQKAQELERQSAARNFSAMNTLQENACRIALLEDELIS